MIEVTVNNHGGVGINPDVMYGVIDPGGYLVRNQPVGFSLRWWRMYQLDTATPSGFTENRLGYCVRVTHVSITAFEFGLLSLLIPRLQHRVIVDMGEPIQGLLGGPMTEDMR